MNNILNINAVFSNLYMEMNNNISMQLRLKGKYKKEELCTEKDPDSYVHYDGAISYKGKYNKRTLYRVVKYDTHIDNTISNVLIQVFYKSEDIDLAPRINIKKINDFNKAHALVDNKIIHFLRIEKQTYGSDTNSLYLNEKHLDEEQFFDFKFSIDKFQKDLLLINKLNKKMKFKFLKKLLIKSKYDFKSLHFKKVEYLQIKGICSHRTHGADYEELEGKFIKKFTGNDIFDIDQKMHLLIRIDRENVISRYDKKFKDNDKIIKHYSTPKYIYVIYQKYLP